MLVTHEHEERTVGALDERGLVRRRGLGVERARVNPAAFEDTPVVGRLAALPRGTPVVRVDDGRGEVTLVVAVVVDRDHEASAAQLHARARGGPAEGHPLFLHVLVQVERPLPGLAVVVGVDHLQVAGALGQQRLVRVLAVGQEDVAPPGFSSPPSVTVTSPRSETLNGVSCPCASVMAPSSIHV